MIIDLHDSKQLETLTPMVRSYKLAFTSGCFDLFHGGHVFFIDQIRKEIPREAKLLVAIHSDNEISKRKGQTRPVLSQEQRAFILDHIKGVDLVGIWNGWLDIIDLVRKIKPDYMATTADKSDLAEKENSQTNWSKIVAEISATPVIIDKNTPYLSTTELISKINESKK